jgi:hypothetical protein
LHCGNSERKGHFILINTTVIPAKEDKEEERGDKRRAGVEEGKREGERSEQNNKKPIIMGNVVASKAFLPPYPSYDEQMPTLVWATSRLGDRIPCTYWAHSSYSTSISHFQSSSSISPVKT